MKIHKANNKLTILLTDNEQWGEVEIKRRDHYGKEQQIWIKIKEINNTKEK